MPERVRAVVIPGLSIGTFLAALQIAALLHALPVTIPAPTQLGAALVRERETLLYHLGPTLWAAVVGYIAAIIAGFALAALATLVRQTKGAIYNLSIITYSVPLLALSPVLVVWLGPGPAARVVIAALAGFFPVLVGSIQGLEATGRAQGELFHLLAASTFQRFWLLAVPNSLPFVFSGLKISAASAVLGAIIAEWAGAERGIGVMMAYAVFSFNVEQAWLAVVVATACAIASYGSISLIERVAVPWQRPSAVGG